MKFLNTLVETFRAMLADSKLATMTDDELHQESHWEGRVGNKYSEELRKREEARAKYGEGL